MPEELIRRLTAGGEYLRRYIAEHHPDLLKPKKRRRSTVLENGRQKQAKISDFYMKSPKSTFHLPLDGSYSIDQNGNADFDADDASTSTGVTTISTASRKCLSYSSTMEPAFALPIVQKLKDLKDLHNFMHKKDDQVENEEKIRKELKVLDEEYKAEYITHMEVQKFEPAFCVKWKGYSKDDNTLEPVENIYDCGAYDKFTSERVQKYQQELDTLWNEIESNTDIDETNLSDAEALKQISKFNFHYFQSNFLMLHTLQREKSKAQNWMDKFQSRITPTIKLASQYFRRTEQLRKIKVFENYVNKEESWKNLHVENLVDFETPPEDFEYQNVVRPQEGIFIPDDPIVGCECECKEKGETCSLKSNCCSTPHSIEFAYTKSGRIRVPQGTPVFECNKRCTCSNDCANRVVQKGRKQSLSIFKTSNGRGWGVRTNRPIAAGQYISEYVGEIITYEETELRGKIYDAEGRTYLFDLDFNEKDNPYTVDAAKVGNVSRFINHSCNPNLGIWAVYINCLDLNLPKLCLFTLRRIEANEELTFDYVRGTELINNAEEAEATEEDVTKKFASSDSFKCLCGAANCRKTLFF